MSNPVVITKDNLAIFIEAMINGDEEIARQRKLQDQYSDAFRTFVEKQYGTDRHPDIAFLSARHPDKVLIATQNGGWIDGRSWRLYTIPLANPKTPA